MNNKKKKLCIYGVIFLLLLLLAFLFPYSHDDWAWGSKAGIERLTNLFDNYNGRWIGNLLVLLLTRSFIVKNIVTAITLTFIIYFIDSIFSDKKSNIRTIIIFLFAFIPHLILRQAVAWTSGFTNYVFPTLLILIYFYYNKGIFNDGIKTKKCKIWLLFLGVLSALCVEHVTIYCVLIGFFFVIYGYIKNKKVDLGNAYYTIGAIGGSILMFSNSAYRSITANNDIYRTINPIKNMINNYFEVIYRELCFNNYVLNIVLSFILVVMLYKSINSLKKSRIINYILMLILIAFPFYTLITNVFRLGLTLFLRYTKYINGLITIVYLIAVFISIIICVKDKQKLISILFNYISIALLTGPLFVVTPIGSRCFFPMYILFIVVICQLINYYTDKYKCNMEIINVIMIVLSCSIYAIYLIIYGTITRVSVARENYLKQHINDSHIVLPKTPYDGFVWILNPNSDMYIERYKLFNNVSLDTEIEFVSYKKWKKIK